MHQRSEIVTGVVEVEAPKDEVPEADAPTEEGKEEGIFWSTMALVWKFNCLNVGELKKNGSAHVFRQ